jgi:HSP20 family protein
VQDQEVVMTKAFLPSVFGNEPTSLQSLFRDIEKSFEEFSRNTPFGGPFRAALAPKIDVAEGKDGLDVTVELPGVEEKDISVTVNDDVLTIRGEKKTERDEKDKNWHVVERNYGSFSRSIGLPYQPDAAKVEAKLEKGVLRVHLPKSAEAASKEKKIEIKKA